VFLHFHVLMRSIGTVAVVSVLLAFAGCKDSGNSQAESDTTRARASGGFTPENNSAAYKPGDKGSPSGAQPKYFNPDAGANPAAETVPPLPGKPPPPPLPQQQTPTPSGKAGGTLPR
jgi:hypothetical protein